MISTTRLVQVLCGIGLAWVAALALCSLLLHHQVDLGPAGKHFSSEDIQTGLDYTFQRKLVSWLSVAAQLSVLTLLALSPWGRRLVAWTEGRSKGRWFYSLLLMWGVVYLALTVSSFPFSVVAWTVRRHWDTDKRDFAAWLADYLKSLGVDALLASLGPLLVVYLLLRWKSRVWWLTWWLTTVAVTTLLAVVMAYLYPLVVEPLFHTFTPLRQTPWASLEPKVREMTNEAQIEVGDILVMDASRTGSHTNAYFSGFGPSRRIVFYDTFLKIHDEDETLSVLGHEIGHWKHSHILIGLALGGLAALLSLALLAWLLGRLVARSPWQLRAPSDPAGVPLVMLLTTLALWLATPLQNTVSRAMERQADEYALELAGRKEAFIAVELKMGRVNKGNVTPHPVNVFLFSTHPPTLERIALAERWR